MVSFPEAEPFQPAGTGWEPYWIEIRQQVCTQCQQRPQGGPPCAPLGHLCGVELHLPLVIHTLRELPEEPEASPAQSTHQRVCQRCVYLHSVQCPCAVQRLSVSLAQAVQATGREHPRHVAAGEVGGAADMTAIYRVYQVAAGTWVGCDWATHFGRRALNLNGWSSSQAEVMAHTIPDPVEADDWLAAAVWLAQVEHRALQAEYEAGLAVASAHVGAWPEALRRARRAWGLESATGRPFGHLLPPAWQQLLEAIDAVAAQRREGQAAHEVDAADAEGLFRERAL